MASSAKSSPDRGHKEPPATQEEELILDDEFFSNDKEDDTATHTSTATSSEKSQKPTKSADPVEQSPETRIGNDPIRLYFNDIGKVALLKIDQEFWLSARMVATRRLDIIGRQHPLARGGLSPMRSIYSALFTEMITSWQRFQEDIKRFNYQGALICASTWQPTVFGGKTHFGMLLPKMPLPFLSHFMRYRMPARPSCNAI